MIQAVLYRSYIPTSESQQEKKILVCQWHRREVVITTLTFFRTGNKAKRLSSLNHTSKTIHHHHHHHHYHHSHNHSSDNYRKKK